jgi:hypothetical protein
MCAIIGHLGSAHGGLEPDGSPQQPEKLLASGNGDFMV